MTDEIKRQKCNRCKVNMTLDKFKKKRDDTYQKNCNDCLKKVKVWNNNNNKCEHNKIRSQCKLCGGVSICIHDRRRSNCKLCGGVSICIHDRIQSSCKDCGGVSICIHDRRRSRCKDCGGVSICIHDRIRSSCKQCENPIKLTIKNMINKSKQHDKKKNRYDADRFIDKCFLEGLVEEYPNCYYEDCKVELQYIEYQDNLATIERLDNNIGHIKSNCVICCLKCNNMRKSNDNIE